MGAIQLGISPGMVPVPGGAVAYHDDGAAWLMGTIMQNEPDSATVPEDQPPDKPIPHQFDILHPGDKMPIVEAISNHRTSQRNKAYERFKQSIETSAPVPGANEVEKQRRAENAKGKPVQDFLNNFNEQEETYENQLKDLKLIPSAA